MKTFLLFLFSALLTACATQNSATNNLTSLNTNSCTYQAIDITNDDKIIDGGYTCPSSSPEANYSINECSKVETYTRKDGTVVASHTRCKYNLSPTSNSSISDSTTTDLASLGSNSCTYQAIDITNTDEIIDGGYTCPSSSPEANYSINECSKVETYTRKDGTVVAGHTRCKYNLPPISSSSTPSSSLSSSSASCVTSYCGPVHVKGYYRKDGTYVRPHTRSRPRR